MKILLLGANGQLGRTFLREDGLSSRGTVVAASRDGVLTEGGDGGIADLGAPQTVLDLLERERPDVIINAAAYTAVDRAEQDEAAATIVNGDTVGHLGTWAAAHRSLVVHYSTDYVFAGDASTPYADQSTTSPAGAYGRSKLAGELALRASGAAHFIFRTAWVYSPVGNNFLRTMLRLGAERDELRVVADQRGTPTDTTLIVDGTLAALDRWMASDSRHELEGTYHLTASGETTWHGFATAIFAGAVKRGILARAPALEAISTAEFPTPARRPAYSVLDNRRFIEVFGLDLPHWQAGVDRTLDALITPPD
ncbi:dTDP-4-dehydrorhamnose reductase [Luteibacter sp. 329MFSha]|uniref:dTDP-4-dehydrorhamnose reductase n=1 Tax=Luteibacter sp. 329MFSha TaxID=1798239 RepID=UPI0008C9BBB6|nr:dTDP-4-dehydrorhamnose reductase [Luteibacter sp. 329MFSha]SEW16688.1 dTDP-4-dehydrorhamnose reductase [Luteibacter sp. 329MFSha]